MKEVTNVNNDFAEQIPVCNTPLPTVTLVPIKPRGIGNLPRVIRPELQTSNGGMILVY